ncbi:hypothetical protein ADICYQ_5344 [Cyclobacterium qasimii M12-11B]|uniref:Uncharacterized protein n=1 Tax=Cyclobacterium qasimii M12-11B TaxID=641524 RepID=S7V7S8_9BACT|nr:hypothetical protein ADICYQ_5344 [Cyclobacterium qasimii M12-11B]
MDAQEGPILSKVGLIFIIVKAKVVLKIYLNHFPKPQSIIDLGRRQFRIY